MKHLLVSARAGAAKASRRRWIYGGTAGVAAVLAYLLLPLGRGGPDLRLVAAAPGGGYAEEVRVPAAWVDTTDLAAGAVMRVPLVLAVENVGDEGTQAGRLELSVPIRYRLVRRNGQPLTGQLGTGSPLVRYELPTGVPRAEPGGGPAPLAELDTLWLEPLIPSFYCMSLSDSVPEFVPAPAPAVEAIARVRIFYSFDGGELERRQTGLLTVQLDPVLLERESPSAPPVYPAEFREPSAPMPALGALAYGGYRRSFCGEPEFPVELLTTLWTTPSGGRFFVIDHGGVPRKYLFDLNGDSIIELEMWDPDADGDFESWREARLPIPAFLLPPPAPAMPDLAYLDAIPADSLAAYDRYGEIAYERYEPRTTPPDTARPESRGRFRPLAFSGNADDDSDGGIGRTIRPSGSDVAAVPPLRGAPSTSGPTRAPAIRPPGARSGGATSGGAGAGGAATGGAAAGAARTAPARAGRDAAERAEPVRPAPGDADAAGAAADAAARRDPRPPPRLLGRPVDSIAPPVRPDTTGLRR